MRNHQNIQIARHWLVVGAAPSARDYFDIAMAWRMRIYDAFDIATNAAWQLYATHDQDHIAPDYYWASDAHACDLFARAIRWMNRLGTNIITLDRVMSAVAARGLIGCDPILIDMADSEPPRYTHGRWKYARFSGLNCLQVAAQCSEPGGAIVLVGMTGYRSSRTNVRVDSLDGRLGKESGAEQTRDWIGPYTQCVIDAHPYTRFIIAGEPQYDVHGRNVAIAHTPKQLEELLT